MSLSLNELSPLDCPSSFAAEFVDTLDGDTWTELGVEIEGTRCERRPTISGRRSERARLGGSVRVTDPCRAATVLGPWFPWSAVHPRRGSGCRQGGPWSEAGVETECGAYRTDMANGGKHRERASLTCEIVPGSPVSSKRLCGNNCGNISGCRALIPAISYKYEVAYTPIPSASYTFLPCLNNFPSSPFLGINVYQ